MSVNIRQKIKINLLIFVISVYSIKQGFHKIKWLQDKGSYLEATHCMTPSLPDLLQILLDCQVQRLSQIIAF